MVEQGIVCMMHHWSENFVFECWVICQTHFRTAVNHGYGQKPLTVSSTWVQHRERPSPCQSVSLHFPAPPSPSLFPSVVDISMENNLCGIKKHVTLFPFEAFVPHSRINRKNQRNLLCMFRGAFVSAKKVNIGNSRHRKDSAHVWSLGRLVRFVKAIWGDASLQWCIHVQIESRANEIKSRLVKKSFSVSCCQQLAASCSLVELAVLRQAGRFQHCIVRV